MTDKLIELARQAGFIIDEDSRQHQPNCIVAPATLVDEFLNRFAKLVAAAEREKVERWEIGSGFTPGPENNIEDVLVELEQQIREDEREACAKLVEALNDGLRTQPTKDECATAIRARP